MTFFLHFLWTVQTDINPIAKNFKKQNNLSLSLPEAKCVSHKTPHKNYSWFLCHSTQPLCSPWRERWQNLSNAEQSRAAWTGRDTDERTHTPVMSTCWGGQPFPLACYSADQGQAGGQIKVLVLGELGPGAREAAWGGVCEHTRPRPRWRTRSERGAVRVTGVKAVRLLLGCWKRQSWRRF